MTIRQHVSTRLGRFGRVLAILSTMVFVSSALSAPGSAGADPTPVGCGERAAAYPNPYGMIHPVAASAHCTDPPYDNEPAYNGSPPLTDHGRGGTTAPGDPIYVQPIYWAPSGYSFAPGYQAVIDKYLADVAHDSGQGTNVFATTAQYVDQGGGPADYRIQIAPAIVDTNPYPASGCPVAKGAIYADGTGYSHCLTDYQLQTEVVADDGYYLPVIFTPEGVETCLASNGDRCTANPDSSTSAFCGYHNWYSLDGYYPWGGYAALPYPIYNSTNPAVGGCISAGVQSPNGNPDADIEINALSYELAATITDPYLDSWFDSSFKENAGECAYIYGAVSGSDGAYYNQTINGDHYFTQEEFSNEAYNAGQDPCVQGTFGVGFPPKISGVSPNIGATIGGENVTITGTGFTGATDVEFSRTSVPIKSVSQNSITVTSPAHVAGTVSIKVTTAGGTSELVTADHYTFSKTPTKVTGVSPSAGPTAGGQYVWISGTDMAGVNRVMFSGVDATYFSSSVNGVTARVPPHAAGTVNVKVFTDNSQSPLVPADRYTYVEPPSVTGINPNTGPVTGGQTVTITGANLRGATGVMFGQTAGTVLSSTANSVRVRTPGHKHEPVDVTVITPGGTSPAVPGDRYTFAGR